VRDKVYIVWLEGTPPDEYLEVADEILAVCASEEDAKEYIEDWAWARVESRIASSEEALKDMQDEEKEAIKQRLFITDHKVLGCASV
jgi:hypothetical protein